MHSISQKILNSTTDLIDQKSSIRLSTDKLNSIKYIWKEFIKLLNSLVSSYTTLGKFYLEDSEKLKNFITISKDNTGILYILALISQYLETIGENYSSLGLDFSKKTQTKYKKFNTSIENFRKEFKQKSYEILEEINKLMIEIKAEQAKLEKNTREQETIHNIVENIEVNLKNVNKTYENGLKNTEIRLEKEISKIEVDLGKINEEINERITLIKNANLKSSIKITEIEADCMQNMQDLIENVFTLVLNISEFKREISERLNYSLENVSFGSTDNENIDISDPLSRSDKNIVNLSFLKETLQKICENEDSIEKDYIKQKNSSYFIKHTDSKIITNTLLMLKDLENIFSLTVRSNNNIRASIIKPLDGIIRIQTSLNSSIRISIKKLSLSFQKSEKQYITNLNRSFSLSPPRPDTEKIAKLKENEKKEIKVLIKDHLDKENLHFSNIKHILHNIHKIYNEFYEEIHVFHRKLVNNNNIQIQKSNKNENNYQKQNTDIMQALKKTGRNNFKVNVSDSTSSDDLEFNNRFSLAIKESVIASFLCAYSDKILLQGKIYITHSYLCFFSYFNSSTFFGKDTILQIKLSDITKIEKKVNVFIFDNSIEITTKSSQFFFTSFISRDEAFSIIYRLLSIQHKQDHSDHSPVEFLIETRPVRLEIHNNLKNSVKDPFQAMFPNSYFTENVFVPEIEVEIEVAQVYDLLFSDNSKEFLTEYLEDAGDIEISIENWSNIPPDAYLGKEGSAWNHSANRTIRTSHKLKERLPLMPLHCALIERQNIYFFSQEKFVIDSDFEVNAPYGEYFRSYLRWTVSKQEKTTISAKYGMIFSGYTIFQGKILREGTKETLSTLNNIWKKHALRKIQLSQGIIEEKPIFVNVPEKIPQKKMEINWELWGIIIILLLIIIKQWQNNNKLQIELLELKKKFN